MKKLNEYKFLIIFFIIGLVLIYLPIPYYIEGTGGLISLSDRFEINGERAENYNLAYVTNIKGTPMNALLAFLSSNYDLEKQTSLNGYSKEEKIRGKLFLEEANTDALIYAYTKANKNVSILKEEIYVAHVYEEANTDLKVGDLIKKIDGKEISSLNDIRNILKDKNIDDKIEIELLNGEKRYAYVKLSDDVKIIGIYPSSIKEVEVDPKINFNFTKKESGSSGGFMTSLAIYDLLVEEDISKGLKIAGTGTIDIDGNVGEIGGIKYKIKGAIKDKADVFFVPKENYDEAIKTRNKAKSNLKIISITHFDDALEYLKSV